MKRCSLVACIAITYLSILPRVVSAQACERELNRYVDIVWNNIEYFRSTVRESAASADEIRKRKQASLEDYIQRAAPIDLRRFEEAEPSQIELIRQRLAIQQGAGPDGLLSRRDLYDRELTLCAIRNRASFVRLQSRGDSSSAQATPVSPDRSEEWCAPEHLQSLTQQIEANTNAISAIVDFRMALGRKISSATGADMNRLVDEVVSWVGPRIRKAEHLAAEEILCRISRRAGERRAVLKAWKESKSVTEYVNAKAPFGEAADPKAAARLKDAMASVTPQIVGDTPGTPKKSILLTLKGTIDGTPQLSCNVNMCKSGHNGQRIAEARSKFQQFSCRDISEGKGGAPAVVAGMANQCGKALDDEILAEKCEELCTRRLRCSTGAPNESCADLYFE